MYFLWSVNEIILPVNETGLRRGKLHEFPLMQPTPQHRVICTGAPSLAQETLPVKATSPSRITGIKCGLGSPLSSTQERGGGSPVSQVGLCQPLAAF